MRGGLEPGVFGPSVTHGKPRSGGPDWRRVGLLAVSIVVAFAVVTSATYAGLVWWEFRQIGRNAVDIGAPEVTFAPETEGGEALVVPEVEPVEERTTILLVGSDSREGLTEEQLQRIGTDPTDTDLTDTIILLQIDPQTDTAAMLSFPRDLVVERCDGSRGRINQAYAIGEEQREGYGPECLVRTIQALTLIEVDHYVRVNFAGFVSAVDALGGVEFYVEEPIQDRYSGIDIDQAGCVAFDGVRALQFVRARRVDNDFGRIARQQRFAREMLNKATSLGTLARPDRVASLIGSISDVLETDRAFGASEMVDLISSIQDISSGRIDARTVPATPGNLGEASVVYAIEEDAEALYRAFRNGDLLPEGVGTDAGPVELGPSNTIPVSIQNGSDVEGLAEETAAVLEALEFRVGEVGTAENYRFEASVILYPEGRRPHAEVLSEALGGISINEGNTSELTLILGSGFDPDAHAPEGFDASETPSPSASPEPTASETEFVGAQESDVAC
ncbi:LCP family protein [Euzebya sp.]|uniref:LCP family protein n=1 Tax=Euzebya sp. TaxID=1971409 RepID=UPI003518363E